MTDAHEGGARALRDDLLLLPLHDPFARDVDLTSQGYALLVGDSAVLVDTTSEENLPALRRLRDAGHRPAALVLTHRDVVAPAQAQIAEELGIPVLLHPADAAFPRPRSVGTRYEDPTRSEVLAALGVEVIFFPGHTVGHVLVYARAGGGTLFTGDAAMGPYETQRRAGVEQLIRPPASLNHDDEQLRRGWQAFDRPVASVLPVHGGIFVDRARDLSRIMAPLQRPEPTPDFPR